MRQRKWNSRLLATTLVLSLFFSSQAFSVFAQEPVNEETIRVDESMNENTEAEQQKTNAADDGLSEGRTQEETEPADNEDVFADSEGDALESESDIDIESKDSDEIEDTEEEAVLETTAELPGNPRIVSDYSMSESGQRVTWDCVWFGSYPQREVVKQASDCGIYGRTYASADDYIVDAALYSSLQSATWDNEEATIGGVKYRRVQASDVTYTSTEREYFNWSSSITYRYFRYDPIKWRVLNVSSGKALLLADQALDDQKYNTNDTDVTWETSSMRSWLNGYEASSNQPGTSYTSKNFINSAFSDTEKSAIQTTSVVNDNNFSSGTPGGSNTSDKIFLLSESEGAANSYGFVTAKGTYDEARRCKSSTFAKAMGVASYTSTRYWYGGNCYWWLRSPGNNTNIAANVHVYGCILDYAWNVDDGNAATRPALYLDMSYNTWSYAGTVCSDGTINELLPSERAIIVVPGILGSELETPSIISKYEGNGRTKYYAMAGERVWMPQDFQDTGISLSLPEDDLFILGCNADGNSNHLLLPVSSEPNSDHIGALGTYTRLVNDLYNTYDKGTDEAYDVQYFPYDWRMSVDVAAEKLEAFIKQKGYNKVILVCHSMGGLVASSYLNRNDENKNKTEKLVTLGTPYWGAPKALNVLETGEMMDGVAKIATQKFFKKAAQNLPTIYELMPSSSYMEYSSIAYTYKGNLLKSSWDDEDAFIPISVNDLKSKVIDPAHNLKLYNQGLSVTEQFTDNKALKDVDSYIIYGDMIETVSAVTFDSMYKVKDIRICYGDGTVPRASAVAGSMFQGNTAIPLKIDNYSTEKRFQNVSHTGLASDSKKVRDYVKEVIDSSDVEIQTAEDEDAPESIGALTKLYISGAKYFKITDLSGNTLFSKTAGGFFVEDGYENAFYLLDDSSETLIAFLDPNIYHIETIELIGNEFSCTRTEYLDYENDEIGNLDIYEIKNVDEKTKVKINTSENSFTIDKDNDGVFESGEKSLTIDDVVDATGIAVSETSLTLEKGEIFTLSADITPQNATSIIDWYSDDETVAEVSGKGKIKAKAVGRTVIYAVIDGVSAECTIQVTPVDPSRCTHIFGDWSITKEATVVAAGIKERVCSECNYKETQVIPQKPKGSQTIIGGISSKKIKVKSVKKKAQKFAIGAIASTPVTYKLAGYVDKKTKKAKKYFKVASNGTVTVKKGCKKGTYKLKIKMSAAGNAYYNAAPSVTRKITIKVK